MLTRPSSRIVGSASALALATALMAGPAHGQATTSYNAPDPTIVSGSVNFVRGSVTGVETYFINSPTAVIDFVPFDAATGGPPIDFQAAGTKVTYQGVSDYTVLNRIVPADPTRAIQFNGEVISRLGAGAPIAGGSVWFYSPGGIILGGTAKFDVGSLLLATGDPTGGTGTISSTNSFSIASAANSNAAITISANAQIKATPENSYVALVAPVVNQAGSVRVNGSAAYVAAEQASLTINQGLFDIDVVVGSDGAGAPLTHLGTTGGPSSNGSGDNHGIYMVAVPKNTAITMLIAPSGDLGFDAAASASIENGAIYLQAGGDVSVTAGNPVESRIVSLPDSPLGAVISLTGGPTGTNITSSLIAQATGNTTVQSSVNNRLISLQGDNYIYSAKTASLTNSSTQPLTVDGRLIVHAIGPVAGQANVLASANSTILLGDTVDVYASPYIGRSYSTAFAVNQGGTAFVQANGTGASISAAGAVNVFAQGVDPAGSKDTVGGSARLFASNGGQITVGAAASLNASASVFGLGRTATGGSAILEVDNGTLSIADVTTIAALGQGSASAAAVGGTARFVTNVQGGSITAKDVTIDASGVAFSTSSGPGGTGKGGTAAFDLSTTGKSATVTVQNVTMKAQGLGGDAGISGSFAGGAATGGVVRTAVFKGTSATVANFNEFADAVGGDGGPGGAGGAAAAGSALFQTSGALTFQNAFIQTGAVGGNGGEGPTPTTPGGAGGAATANANGLVFQALNGGTMNANSASLLASAAGGAGGQGQGGTGLAGSGGSATASGIFLNTAPSGGQIKFANGLTLSADAGGGSTGSGTGAGTAKGGSATGGSINVTASAGLIEVNDVSAGASAAGGNAFANLADGGDATGGLLLFSALTGATLRVTNGNAGFTGNAVAASNTGGGDKIGGVAAGGRVDVNANGGLIEIANGDLFASSNAIGGGFAGTSGGAGGSATGGNSRVIASAGGTFDLAGDATVSAIGSAGSVFSPDGKGGAGIGGEARLGTNIGSPAGTTFIVAGDIEADAGGFGGQGGTTSGIGGDGIGGAPADPVNGPFDKGAYLAATGGAVTIGGDTDLEAIGFGGDGGAQGGAGLGGWVETFISGATLDLGGALTLDSSALGGSGQGAGGIGGKGTGGFAAVTAASGGRFGVPTNATSRITGLQILLNAGAGGGSGSTGALGSTGGRGGDGVAGQANATAQAGGGTLDAQNVIIFLAGEGGNGGNGGAEDAGGIGGAGGRGGDGTGGFTNFGTVSGTDTPINAGSAKFGDLSVFLAGVGGSGGDGVIGTKGGGAAGTGGDAFGGTGAVLTRGAPVTANTISLVSQANGGSAGEGASPGTGGSATGGRVGIVASNRFNRTERGFLNAVQFSAASIAIGGFNGASFAPSTAGQAYAQVSKADVVIDTIQLNSSGDLPPVAGNESFIKVDNGLLEGVASLGVSVVGDFQLSVVDNGVLRGESVNIFSTGSLLPAAAGAPGQIEVGSFFLADFQQDFVTTANFDVVGDVSIRAGGELQAGNIVSGGAVDLSSGNLLQTGDVKAGGSISVTAGTEAITGDLSAGEDSANTDAGVLVEATTGVTTGNLRGPFVEIEDGVDGASVTGLQIGDIETEVLTLTGQGSIRTGKITQGNLFPDSPLDVNGAVFVTAEGPVSTLDILAQDFVSITSTSGSLALAKIDTEDSIFLTAAGSIDAGNLTAALGIPELFNGEVVVSTPGSVTVGDVRGASIEFQVGDPVDPGSTVQTGALTAETITLDVAGSLQSGDIRTAELYSAIDTSEDEYLIGIGAFGDLKLGKVDAFTSVGIGSVTGKVETGSIFAADSVLLLGKTGVATGGIDTGGDAGGSVFISNTSIIENHPAFAVLQDFDEFGGEFEIDVLKTAVPERVNGPITIAGDVSTIHFAAATAQSFMSGSLSAPNRLYIDAGGSITGNALGTSGALELISDQDITLGDLTAASVSVKSGQNVTTGAISASGAVALTANSFAVINGQVVGSTIDVTSGDIAIGPAGRLGNSGTTRLTLTATGSSPRFGGTVGDTQYSLSSQEASLLRAQLIELRSPSTAQVGDMTLQGSLAGPTANLVGPNGRLLIESGYGMTVAGQVIINNAANTNRLALLSGEGIDIVTDQGGGIAMFGANSSELGGVLSLSGSSVRAATFALLDQLGSLAGDQRTQALRTPPSGSPPRPQGYLQANRIEFAANQLLIQNSNTSTLFGGFSAGAGGANLRGRSSSPIDAIIYGRIADGSGAFKTNADAVALLTLTTGEGQSTVTSASLFNDCAFTGPCGTPEPPPPEEQEDDEVELMIDRIPAVIAAAVSDVMASTTDPESLAALPTVNLVTTIDTGPLRTEPVISDPVTGGGNPGLWEAPSDQNRREDDRPAPGGEEE